MLITKKMLLALALAVAFVGAGVGALVTHSASNTAANTSADANPIVNQSEKTPEQIATENSAQFRTSAEQTAYRQGVDDGYTSCSTARANTSSRTLGNSAPVRYSNDRAVAYNNHAVSTAPRGRTFWQKHRDKLTLAMGTGGGAMLGGLVGGKKGAGIGALAGLGGSALYTYKLRHRRHRN